MWLKMRTPAMSLPERQSETITNVRRQLLLLPGLVERPLDRVVDIGRDRMIPPEPSHHLGQNRSAHSLAVSVHAPRVVHVVALVGERPHQPHVLVEPIAALIVGAAAAAHTSVVISSVLQKDPNGPLVALLDDIGVRIAAAQIHE